MTPPPSRVSYSGALNASDAQDLAAFHLVTPGKNKQFGTKGANTVKLKSATYDPGAHTVTLTAKGIVPNPPLQLQINPALVHDGEGRPIMRMMVFRGRTLRPVMAAG
jgi:hypothetical protein